MQPMLESLRTDYNMMGEPHERRGDWAKELGVKDLAKTTAKYVFHAGCRYSFDGEQSEVARTAVEILKKAGVDFGIMGSGRKLLRRPARSAWASTSSCTGRRITI